MEGPVIKIYLNVSTHTHNTALRCNNYWASRAKTLLQSSGLTVANDEEVANDHSDEEQRHSDPG